MAVVTASLRTMERSDVPAVAGLEVASFDEPWSEGVLADELSLADRRYVVAEDTTGVIVGYGGLMKVGEDAHVLTLAVHPDHRRRGIGTRLLLWLVDTAIGEGVANLTLEVRVSNEPAQGLYRRFGFEPVGVRPKYYRDEDALIMWAVDADGDAAALRMAAIREGLA